MRILIHEKPDRAKELSSILEQHGVTDVQHHWGRETLLDHMHGVDVLVTEYAPEEVITAGSSSLKLIQCLYRGVDGIDLAAAKRANVQVAHTSANIVTTAEHALALMLALAKKILPADQTLRKGQWSYGYYGSEYSTVLQGKTLAIIGFGAIGSAIAARARCFGMRILGIRRTSTSVPHYQVYRLDKLHDVLREADFIIVSVALTQETKGIIGVNEFAVMKPNAFFVNISRGGLVDPEALYSALKERRIAGAGIDVWYRYPSFLAKEDTPTYPATQPFHELDNIIMTPHRGGFSRESNDAFVKEAAENIARFVHGNSLEGLVNLELGY